ncbi:MAG: ankyrin repeat domain-containing protein [Candidatus Chromulinivorax sp.]|nr:ankyrin repeat domain-containing protein [Candidatus Chromulinivorax sp.]
MITSKQSVCTIFLIICIATNIPQYIQSMHEENFFKNDFEVIDVELWINHDLEKKYKKLYTIYAQYILNRTNKSIEYKTNNQIYSVKESCEIYMWRQQQQILAAQSASTIILQNPTINTQNKATILHYLSKGNANLETIKLLLQNSEIDVNVTTKNNTMPIHYAICNQQTSIIDLLLQHGAKDHLLNHNGFHSPLFYAMCHLKDETYVDSLIETAFTTHQMNIKKSNQTDTMIHNNNNQTISAIKRDFINLQETPLALHAVTKKNKVEYYPAFVKQEKLPVNNTTITLQNNGEKHLYNNKMYNSQGSITSQIEIEMIARQ